MNSEDDKSHNRHASPYPRAFTAAQAVLAAPDLFESRDSTTDLERQAIELILRETLKMKKFPLPA